MTTSKDLTDIHQNCAALRTRMAARGVTRAYDAALRPLGLKITQFTLLVASRHDAQMSIGDMADALAMERSTLTRNLKLLVARGLVTMKKGTVPRTKVPALTPDGEAALERAIPLWRKAQKDMVSHMGKTRWQAARGLLDDLAHIAA